jgi:hypothetical protein
MATANVSDTTSNRTQFPHTTSIPSAWRHLSEQFAQDFRRAPAARLFHALQIRSGVPEAADEKEEEWRLQLEVSVRKIDPLLERIPWFIAESRRGATRKLQHCPYGSFDNVTRDLIFAANDLVESHPLVSGLGTDSFFLLLYLVAWARPHDVSYRIHQRSFQPWAPMQARPFNSVKDFERWEDGKLELPEGRYFISLNCDVRQCAVSAIETLFGSESEKPLAIPPSKEPRLTVDTSRHVVIADGMEHNVDPHETQMLNALLEPKESGEWWVTGPEMQDLPACHGKKISRLINQLENNIPALKGLITHGGNKGYRLKE